MELCYIEPFNIEYHGDTNLDLSNKYISIFIPFTLNEFYDLNKDQFILHHDNRTIKLEIVLQYKIKNEITLSYIKTDSLIKFQKLWREYYTQKKRFYTNPNNLYSRSITGKFPTFKFKKS